MDVILRFIDIVLEQRLDSLEFSWKPHQDIIQKEVISVSPNRHYDPYLLYYLSASESIHFPS